MKACFVVHSFDEKDRGGVLKVISDLTCSFSEKNNIDLTIVSFGCIDNLAFNLNPNVKVISLGMVKYNTTYYSGFFKLWWFIRAYKSIINVLNNSPDCVWITSSPPISILFSLIKMIKKIKVIGCDHISTLYRGTGLFSKFRNLLLAKLDCMVALTPPDEDYYIKNNIKSRYIPNGVAMNNKNDSNSRKYITFVGRFHSVKQPLRAMELFISSGIYKNGFVMRMYGHGDLIDEIYTFVKSNNYQDFFEIITNENDQNKIFSDSYLLLMTSVVEGFPLVLLEAISRNVPCLAFDCPYGPSTIIENGVNGYILKDDDIDFLEKFHLIKNLHNHDISVSCADFGIDIVADRWLELINEVNCN